MTKDELDVALIAFTNKLTRRVGLMFMAFIIAFLALVGFSR